MGRTYKLDNAEDVVELAKYVQTQVYWGAHYTDDEDDEHVAYSDFWDVCETMVAEGYNVVTITEDEEVRFSEEVR